jgi:hypothetical protein
MAETINVEVHLPDPHEKQEDFIRSLAKRKVIRAGRRGGKTVGVAILAVERFLDGQRVLYAAPTAQQLDAFWFVVSNALKPLIDVGWLKVNNGEHYIERRGTKRRIKAKTAWNADTLRGDYADLLILDEWQLMNEEAWGRVGAPMLLDNDGDAVFIYTPPSLQSRSATKADDPQHAAKMFKRAAADISGRWETFHFKSSENPHISETALAEISGDMTALAYRQEIEAEDVDEAPGALWSRDILEKYRHIAGRLPPQVELVVAIDPSTTSAGDEAGIITAFSSLQPGVGKHRRHLYILEDNSMQGSPQAWATAAVQAYHRHKADFIIAEANQGGEMVAQVIKHIDEQVPVRLVHASRGKQTRAAPVSVLFEQGRGHMVGSFPMLEDELCLWVPGDPSPNRLDALVWAGTWLIIRHKKKDKPPVKSHSMVTG